ncbi:MAG TPA: site-specific integrase [Pyrinomonadaceae bacterium]|nr:site-specific integrase [Pyrinomonadaceae bacterium]
MPEEEEALMRVLDANRPFLKPLVQLALWTGFRQCELIALKKSHIDFRRKLIFVADPKWKKDKRKTECNPLDAETCELLERLCRESPGEHLFVNDRDGQPLTQGVVDKAFRRACHEAGIYGFNFHALRHTFGTRLADADVNLKKIARLMGHSTTKHTEIYVHTMDDGLREALRHAKVKGGEEKYRNRSGAVRQISSRTA